MSQIPHDTRLGAKEGTGQLRNRFLGGLGSGSRIIREIAVGPGSLATPMTFLVKRRGVETLGGFEGLEARPDDTIEQWDEGRLVSPAPDVRAYDVNERLSLAMVCFWREKRRLYKPPA
jgi:hypothetical protein